MKMPINYIKGDKKKSLLASKDKLLQEIKYLEHSINEARTTVNNFDNFEDESSDSEVEFQLADCGPSLLQLRKNEKMLQTCLQATCELTSLDVLQYEINVMVQKPRIEGEAPVREPGVWREVTAECCIDLIIPFAITFYIHTPQRKFGGASFRSVRVTPLKAPHAAELSGSVLAGLTTPSDAIEVLRSFAVSYRSRRATLAKLVDRFGAMLSMEPIPTGGYMLKCANLLEMSWTLQNKWSPIAPFHHKLKFELEYMDEEYVKTISQAHRQLSDPAVDTEERTMLLGRIIAACIQAGGLTGAGEPEWGDREVMAPPKSLPKKTKRKSKENTPNNKKEQKSVLDERKSTQKGVKRSIADDNSKGNGKKLKSNEIREDGVMNDEMEVHEGNNDERVDETTAKKGLKNDVAEKNGVSTESVDKKKQKVTSADSSSKKSVTSERKMQQKVTNENKSQKANDNAGIDVKNTVKTGASEKNNQKAVTNDKKAQKMTQKAVPKENNGLKTVSGETSKPNAAITETKTQKPPNSGKNKNARPESAKDKETVNATARKQGIDEGVTTTKKADNDTATTKKTAQNRVNKVGENKKSVTKSSENAKNYTKKTKVDKNTPLAEDNVRQNDTYTKNNNSDKNDKNGGKEKAVVINNNKTKQVSNQTDTVKKTSNQNQGVKNNVKDNNYVGSIDKTASNVANKVKTVQNSIASSKNVVATTKNSVTSIKNKVDAKPTEKTNQGVDKNTNIKKPLNSANEKTNKPVPTSVGIKKSSGNTEKENLLSKKIVSKIPHKKIATPRGVQKFPIRMSPRNQVLKPKPLAGSNTKVPKPTTNIPRLLSKPNNKIY